MIKYYTLLGSICNCARSIHFIFLAFTLNLYSQSGPLEYYNQVISPSPIDGIDYDLSGVTFNRTNNKLLMIKDDDGIIWESTTNMEITRLLSGADFGDSEDIVYLGNSEYAIVTEEGRLYIGLIHENDMIIQPDSFQEIIFDPHDGNDGAEGVAYDSLNQKFYVVKEKNPMKFGTFDRPSHNNDISIEMMIPFDAESQFYGLVDDLSSITFDYRTNRVLILSDDSQRVLDVDPLNGNIWGVMDVDGMEKGEGLTFINDNYDLLIVGEPNYYTLYSSSLNLNDSYSNMSIILSQNYPNPFNPSTTLQYNLSHDKFVTITIYDMLGNLINVLFDGNQKSGYKFIEWNATNSQGQPVSAGVYLYSIEAGDFRQTKKMMLLK